MEVKISIPEKLSVGLTDHAQDELYDILYNYSELILKEAQRIESGQSSKNKKPEISRLLIQQSAIYLNRMPRKKSLLVIIASICSPITGIVLNFLEKPSGTISQNNLWLFIGVVVIFAVSSIFSIGSTFTGGGK